MRSPSGRYGMGLKPTTPSRVAHRLNARQHARIGVRYALGSSASGNILEAGGAWDQGQSGTCHAHSEALAIWIARNAAGKPLPWLPSPLLVASCAYADMQRAIVAPGQTVAPLQDTGAELQDDADAVRAWGVGPMATMVPGRGGPSDVPDDPSDNSFPEPGASGIGQPADVARLQVSGASLVTGEYAIPVDDKAPALVAASIDAGVAVRTGFFVDGAFEALQPGDVAQPPDTNDSSGGGHSTLLRGYRVNGNGLFEFLMRNSWGAPWCDAGDCWCSTAWLLACWDLHPEPAGT